MAQTPMDDVLSNWHKLIENFETSSKEFYASVRAALERRKVPALKYYPVIWNEGGVLSPKREYLRMTDGRLVFDLCAAPFGTGFFFSWWLVRKPASWVFLYAVTFAIAADLVKVGLDKVTVGIAHLWPYPGLWRSWVFYQPDVVSGMPSLWRLLHLPLTVFGIVLWLFAVLVVFWLVAMLARLGRPAPETSLLSIPIFGRAYGWVFAPVTYHRLDTAIMLRSAVHAAVLEVIDGLTTAKGLRGLSDDDRKPIFHKFN